jgi:hypothetical protein
MHEHRSDAISKKHHNKHLQNKILQILATKLAIKYEKIFTTDNESEAFVKEIETIQYFGLKNLCNLTEGGEGSSGYKHTQEALKKIKTLAGKRNWIGERNPNYGGGHWTDEAKIAFSEYQKQNLLGSRNPFYGKKHTESARKKMSQFHSGKILTEEHKKKIGDHIPWKGKERPEHSKKMSGENNPKAKLTMEQVVAIRKKYKIGDSSYRKLAKEYKIDLSTISDIIKEKTWRTQLVT